MWFYFSLPWEWQNALHGFHLLPGLEEALESWMRSKWVRYWDSEEHCKGVGAHLSCIGRFPWTEWCSSDLYPSQRCPANLELFVCVVFAKFPNLLTWTFSSCIPSALTAPFLEIGIHAASPDSYGSCCCISYCRTERRCLYPAVFQYQALRHRTTGGDVKGSELDRSHRSGSEWWSIQSDILALIMDSAKCCGGSCPLFLLLFNSFPDRGLNYSFSSIVRISVSKKRLILYYSFCSPLDFSFYTS